MTDALTADLLRLADGDRSAFDAVYEAALPRVEALVRRMLGDGPDADDAAQRAMIRVFERASDFDPAIGAAAPWILGIAAWECRTTRARWRRESPRHAPAEALSAVASPDADPESAAIDQGLARALEEVLGVLTPADRATVVAAVGYGARPDVPAATFRKRWQRALERLRLAWRREHG